MIERLSRLLELPEFLVIATLRKCWIGNSPMRNDRLARPDWTRLASVITNSNYEIKLDVTTLFPRFAPRRARVYVIDVLEHFNGRGD